MTSTINEPLQVNDTIDCTGDMKVNTNKLTVDASTGNVVIAGSLTTADYTRYLNIQVGGLILDTTADQDPDETNSNDAPALSFNDTENDIAYFSFSVPEDWDAGNNVVVELIWTSTTTTGNVEWEIDWASVPVDGTESAASDGTDAYIDAAPGTTGYMLSTGTNLAITSGTLAAGDIVFIKVNRDAQAGNGDDTMAGNALLTGIRIRYTASR